MWCVVSVPLVVSYCGFRQNGWFKSINTIESFKCDQGLILRISELIVYFFVAPELHDTMCNCTQKRTSCVTS